MSEPTRFKIDMQPAGSRSRVEMNGEPLRGLRSVTVHTGVGETTTVTLTFGHACVEIKGDAERVVIA